MTSSAIRIREVEDEAEWGSLFAKVARKYMTQTWAFGESKRPVGWSPRRLAITGGGEVLAICQVLQKSVAGITVVSRINLGPLMLDAHAARSAEVHRAIRKHWRFLARGILLLAPALENSEANRTVLRDAGFRLRNDFRWSSSQLNLTQSESWLRSSLSAKWRNQLKKAEQSNLQFRSGNGPQDAEWIIRCHSQNLRDKHFPGPPPESVLALYEASPRDFNVYRATDADGNDLAGMVAYRFGDHAHYYIGWTAGEGRRCNAGNFLLWNAALELKRQDCNRFDLGGHSLIYRGSYDRFKQGMQASCYETAGEFFCF